jgi:hypothetical protein
MAMAGRASSAIAAPHPAMRHPFSQLCRAFAWSFISAPMLAMPDSCRETCVSGMSNS